MDLRITSPPDRAALARNPPKSLALAFFQVFMVFMPIAVPFFGSHGLDMQQVLLLQAWFAGVMLAMEVPSGYFADRVGRKHAIVGGTFFSALGFGMLPAVDGFTGLLVFEALLGIGLSLISGADLALLYDTELALGEGEGGSAPSAVRNLHVAHSASEALAALTCSALMLWSMDAVIWLQAIVGCVPFLIAITLVEPPMHRRSEGVVATTAPRSVAFREVVVHLLGRDAVLRRTVIALAVWSLTTYYAVWILQRYWQDGGVPLAWFGVLWAVCNAASGVAGRFATRVETRLGAPTLLVLVGVLPALGYLGLAALPLLAALLVSLSFFVARGLGLVVLRDALNARTPSHSRATANSLASFGFRAAMVLTAGFVGGLYDSVGATQTMWLLAAATLVVVLFVLVPLARAVSALGADTASRTV